jgi:hypothetical protein
MKLRKLSCKLSLLNSHATFVLVAAGVCDLRKLSCKLSLLIMQNHIGVAVDNYRCSMAIQIFEAMPQSGEMHNIVGNEIQGALNIVYIHSVLTISH